MSSQSRISIDKDVDWFIGYHTLFMRDSETQIIIPVETLDAMTDDEIGKHVKNLIPYAEWFHASCYLDWILDNGLPYPEEYSEDVEKALSVLENHNDQHSQSQRDRILDYLRKKEERSNNKKEAKSKRNKMQSRYKELFYEVGNRDGFHCQNCGADIKLTIDHKQPLINGGDNELSNLQILCKSCNSKKGAR